VGQSDPPTSGTSHAASMSQCEFPSQSWEILGEKILLLGKFSAACDDEATFTHKLAEATKSYLFTSAFSILFVMRFHEN
jgi:hypothetical protein